MGTGYLKIEATIASGGAPAVAAYVQVFKADGSKATGYTDASGIAGVFSLDAPDKELSLDPNYDGEVYSTCNVLIGLEKYKDVYVTGVQLFDGETAVLPVNMEPRMIGVDLPQRDRQRLIIIPEHQAKSENTEPPATPLPEPPEPRIQEFVSIPQSVTVHLGRPAAEAENVTVSFINYIKNVCCSEIYPTWPENALRANIYCQISLVLNRIFTEWYPSRGYPFTITNSTSYDQYFVYGRNIFANISALVDEIFTDYIKKGTAMEPFYAEYCNGTTVTCPGLSQWGTVSLANQGYSPIEILRYYYGSDVALYSAPVVSADIESYPGTPLRVGSTGDAVATVQEQLNRIRRSFPLIPSAGTVDGRFGSLTQASVRAFQSTFDLAADGVVGKATWYRISYIYTSVKKLAELASEGITAPNIVSPVPTVTLRIGSSGSNVTLAQYLLNIASDFYVELYPVTIDGVFGSGTETAVKAFQLMRGLTADGVVGPLTWNALYRVFYSLLNAITPVGTTSYPGTALRVGSTGLSVATMQRYLNYISGFFPSIGQLTIDSIYGQATRSSVVAFQRLFGLAADGVIGQQTWNRIVSVYDTVVSYI